MFAYKRTKCRAILLDYDGTIVPQNSINKTFEAHIIFILNSLCNDPETLFLLLIGGEGHDSLHAKCWVLQQSMTIS